MIQVAYGSGSAKNNTVANYANCCGHEPTDAIRKRPTIGYTPIMQGRISVLNRGTALILSVEFDFVGQQ